MRLFLWYLNTVQIENFGLFLNISSDSKVCQGRLESLCILLVKNSGKKLGFSTNLQCRKDVRGFGVSLELLCSFWHARTRSLSKRVLEAPCRIVTLLLLLLPLLPRVKVQQKKELQRRGGCCTTAKAWEKAQLQRCPPPLLLLLSYLHQLLSLFLYTLL